MQKLKKLQKIIKNVSKANQAKKRISSKVQKKIKLIGKFNF